MTRNPYTRTIHDHARERHSGAHRVLKLERRPSLRESRVLGWRLLAVTLGAPLAGLALFQAGRGVAWLWRYEPHAVIKVALWTVVLLALYVAWWGTTVLRVDLAAKIHHWLKDDTVSPEWLRQDEAKRREEEGAQ